MVWRPEGGLELLQLPNEGHRGTVGLDPAKAALKLAKWAARRDRSRSQRAGQTEITIRAGVDGKLVDERFDILWRRDEMQGLQAVSGNIYNTGSSGWMPSPIETPPADFPAGAST